MTKRVRERLLPPLLMLGAFALGVGGLIGIWPGAIALALAVAASLAIARVAPSVAAATAVGLVIIIVAGVVALWILIEVAPFD